MQPRKHTVRIYPDSLDEWRWIRRDEAGHTIAESPYAYRNSTIAREASDLANPDHHNYRIETARD